MDGAVHVSLLTGKEEIAWKFLEGRRIVRHIGKSRLVINSVLQASTIEFQE